MLLWGFILLVAGGLTSLILFLSNASDIFSYLGSLGFGGYLSLFFDKETLTTEKTFFVIALAAALVGLVLYLVGRARCEAEQRSIIPERVKKFFRDTKSEMKKITWPAIPGVIRNVGVVLAMCAVTGATIVVADLALGGLISLLQGL